MDRDYETGSSEHLPAAAVERWIAAVGADNVVTDTTALASWGRSTLPSTTMPLAVVRAASVDEVAASVAVARDFRIPVYPISTGKNWGYGEANPVVPGNVVLDLSRMNRIVEVNESLAYAVIEPGVTQGQLSAYLRERGHGLWLDCTGAGPNVSIVGNVLDRGFGHTPYGNRTQQICGLDAVLADGSILKTGFGHFDNAKATRVYPYGLGPSLDGLFIQFGFGIVVRMGIWLMPAPERFDLVLCSMAEHEDIAPLIDGLRRLKLNGTLRSVAHIGNDLRAISGSRSFPRDAQPTGARLSDEIRSALRADQRIGAWTMTAGLFGSRAEVAAARREIRRTLRGRGRKLLFLNRSKLEAAGKIATGLARLGIAPGLTAKIEAVRSIYGMNSGLPSPRFLTGAYWRHRRGAPADMARADPAAEGCGLMWLTPVLPCCGDAVLEAHALLSVVFERFGLDLFMTMSTVTDRSLVAVVNIAYDKEDAVETERAAACHRAASEALVEAGYIPYRVAAPEMARLDEAGSPEFWKTLHRLKTAVDPHGLIAPGRYDPAR